MPPYSMRKVRNKNCFTVYKCFAKKSANKTQKNKRCYIYKKNKKKIFSKCTTKEKAIKQLRLLQRITYNKR
jgi:hypothetical protein